MAAVSPHVISAVLLSAVTGARPGELIALKESDLLEDLKVLRITGKKTRFKTAKTVRYFPLVEIVRRILFEALKIKSGEFIFSREGTLTKNYYKFIKAACASCGIVYGRKATGRFESLRFAPHGDDINNAQRRRF